MAYKILVVDDEEGLVLLMETNLQVAGFQVLTAFDGEEALRQVEKEKPDLILLDIRMPRKNGWEVCQELKSREETRSIPIIFLSAYAQREDIARGLKMGAERYITKPADPLDVVNAIEEIRKRGPASANGFTPTENCP